MTERLKNMSGLLDKLSSVDNCVDVSKNIIVNQICNYIENSNYNLHSMDDTRPWGAFFRLENKDAEQFIVEFFSDLNLDDIKLSRQDVELSPKILLVSPKQRLSWQYHNRRAEIWRFLAEGSYARSLTDEIEQISHAESGEVVKFDNQERHRLIGANNSYTIVAEIWQHTDRTNHSDEDDIVRLQDDYNR